jgi:hypothetical protein
MSGIIPDTHERVKRLTAAGLQEAIAEEIVRQSIPSFQDQTSTKTDIELIRRDIEQLRSDTKKDIEQLRADTKKDIELSRKDVIVKIGSMIVVATGILLAANFFAI